ncbi:ROK family transcriptional regulator [Nereida sp. MMG025]|uniref:ROK family transcriptional regulator n=1 Tax=Nereida sp. MMG025 TaxID=2909981 RepID=UPI001F4266E4|nr:ROK family transcriptional regulator [Nereida sp. MMG025]MCF6444037.1 ROK family protein [Nereida sp. MMG025]
MYDVDNENPEAESGCGPISQNVGATPKPLLQQAFEAVRSAGHISRKDLADLLSVSPASVTTLTSDLIAKGLLAESTGARHTQNQSGRGRPKVDLHVARGNRFVVGIKLGDNAHTAVLTDLAGRRYGTATLASPNKKQNLTTLLGQARQVLDMVLTDAGVTHADCRAVGVGIPGVVDFEMGVMAWSPIVEDTNVDLRTQATDALGLPTIVDNDANVLTLAELWFGAGRTMSDFAVVSIENGVGMGVVLHNSLFRGAMGLGLELGHTKVQLDGALCRCGQRGCLEAYLADYALAREAATALQQSHCALQSERDMLEQLYAQAKGGNEAAHMIFLRAGRFLALGLANIVQLFDPQRIILSGDRVLYDYFFPEAIMSEMQKLTLNNNRPPTPIEAHAWGDLVWAQGAMALALDHVTQTLFAKADA